MGITKVRLTKADIIAAVRDENYGDSDLSNLANLSGSGLIERRSEGVIETVPVTDYIKTLLNDATAADARSTLSLGSIATASAASYLPLTGGTLTGALIATSFSGSGASLTALNASNISTGTINAARLPNTYQPLGNELTALQALSDTTGFLRKTGDGTYSIDTSTYLTSNQSISVSGDVTGSGTTSISLTLANSGVVAGTYNNVATQIRPFTVDVKGRVTGIGTAVNITPPWSAITGTPTTLAGYGITDALPLSGGTVTGVTTFSNATSSTSTTTGAICAASLGITGAIFAGSYNLIPVGRGGGNIHSNIVIGVSAGLANTTGSNNSFVGLNAGQSNTTGSNNSFVGLNAGQSNTTGFANSFLGLNAGLSNTTGFNNSFVGVNAGLSNTTGDANSFVGVNAGLANTTGNTNSFVGAYAGRSNTTGVNNSFVGVSAGFANTTGNSNSFVGVDAGRFIADGVTGLTVIDNSCFFGMNTKGTQNATNENVFGYNATGNGSNTVTIGNNNITNTYLKGVVSTDSTATSTSTTTGAIRAASLGITGAIFADSVNATSKIAVGQNFSISSISGYSNISLGNNFTSEYGQSSIEIPTNILYGGFHQHHTGVRLACGEMVNWGTARFKIYVSNSWTTYNPIACFSVGDAGGVFTGSSKASSFFVGNNQVVSDRKTGWVTPTGTATRTTFATSTVTVSQLAERVKGLIDDLTTHGLIGA